MKRINTFFTHLANNFVRIYKFTLFRERKNQKNLNGFDRIRMDTSELQLRILRNLIVELTRQTNLPVKKVEDNR